MSTAPLIVAGSLGILGAAIHGGVGEVLVVRKLSPGTLPPSRAQAMASLATAMVRVLTAGELEERLRELEGRVQKGVAS